MNQATLAEGLGVDVKYVAAVERGDVVPSLYVTRVLTQALDMRPGTLQVPVAVAGDKADEEGAIASYWLRNNLPTGDFVEFVESLENRTGDVQGRINDDEIALLYAIWLQKKQAT
jgi:transcriptional regulator with XRE-family HTH domain